MGRLLKWLSIVLCVTLKALLNKTIFFMNINPLTIWLWSNLNVLLMYVLFTLHVIWKKNNGVSVIFARPWIWNDGAHN